MVRKVIYIGGVARSGTSWLGQIFNSCTNVRFRFQPFFSYEYRGVINEDSASKEYQEFYMSLFENEALFLTQRDKVEKGLYPDFKKDNEDVLVFKENRFQSYIEPMLRKSDNLDFVGIIRNPCAVLFSWSQNNKEFPIGSDIMKEWRFANCKNKGNEDYFGYYKWKEVANLYLDLKDKYKERVEIIHYDKFVEDSLNNTKILLQRIGLPFEEQTKLFLNTSAISNDTNYYSVYKGNSNRQKWKSEFPDYIRTEIQADLKGTRLEEFLY